MPRNGNSLPCAAHHFEMRKDQKAKSMNFSEIDDPPRTMARSLQLLLLFAVTMQGVLRNQVQEMRIDRRAWVGVSIKGFPKPNEPFRITIVLANSGKTFAKHVNLAGHARRYEQGQAPNFRQETKEAANKRNPEKINDTLLAPNATAENTTGV